MPPNANRNVQQRQTGAAPQPPSIIPPIVQDDLDRIAKALEAANASDAAAEKQRVHDNLKAQQDSLKTQQDNLETRQDIARWAFVMLIIAGGATLLMVGGVTLVAYTLGATRRAAAAAGRSADVAERALTVLERPQVYVELTKGVLGIAGAGTRLVFLLAPIEITCFNFGRTPADLRRFDYQLLTAAKDAIPPPIDPDIVGGRELPTGCMAANATPYVEIERDLLFDEIEDKAIADGKRSIWLIGFLRYDDIFGAGHIAGFSFSWDFLGQRFVRRGDHRYNYARIERPAPT